MPGDRGFLNTGQPRVNSRADRGSPISLIVGVHCASFAVVVCRLRKGIRVDNPKLIDLATAMVRSGRFSDAVELLMTRGKQEPGTSSAPPLPLPCPAIRQPGPCPGKALTPTAFCLRSVYNQDLVGFTQ